MRSTISVLAPENC